MDNKPKTIGQRAAREIKERAWKNGTKFVDECDKLPADITCFRAWNKGIASPRAAVLADMVREGYDVIYILTGERKNG